MIVRGIRPERACCTIASPFARVESCSNTHAVARPVVEETPQFQTRKCALVVEREPPFSILQQAPSGRICLTILVDGRRERMVSRTARQYVR